MKKKLTRLFSVLLAAVLVFGTLPVSALGTDVADPPASAVDESVVDESSAAPEAESAVDDAAQPEEQSAEEEAVAVQASTDANEYSMNIFFLDCGRKYYSVDSIKQFIDNASAAGFNYIQLAVGNDGLRFLLDDMKLTVNGTTYSSEEVSSAIHAGNEAYYNFDVDELTESDMDTIIAYANSKGMGVIPCINTPGHMDAILSAATSLTGTDCSYNGSARTINVTNTTAVAFTQALLQKYITYFAGKGCQYFNMGADEYANDKYTSGSMGFGNLLSTRKYGSYVTYVNQVAALIKGAEMTPMAFNDGIYFQSNTSYGTFDTDIVICYWSAGWGIYTPMPASTLASMGFKLVNTHGDYYWVLGKSDVQCSASKASGFNYKSFQGSTIDDPVGSMFCVWADYPGSMTEDEVLKETAATIAAFGKTLPQFEVDDGSIKISIGDSTETATAGELTVNGTMVLTASKAVVWESSDEEVASLTPIVADGANAIVAEKVEVKALKAGNAVITATSGDQIATFDVTVQEIPTKDITVSVNADDSSTVVVGNYPGPYHTDNEAIATVTTSVEEIEGKTSLEAADVGVGTFYVSNSAGETTTPSNQLTFEDAGNGQYYIKNANGQYIYPYASYTGYGNWWDTSLVQGEEKQAVSVTTNESGGIIISATYTSGTRSKTVYLYLRSRYGSYTYAVSERQQTLYLYKNVTSETTYKTTLTFHGVAEGDTFVEIEGVKYNIHVVAEDLSEVDPLKIEYWITNSRGTGAESNNTSYTISAAAAYGENGVEIASLVDKKINGPSEDLERYREYWQTKMLNATLKNDSTSTTELQTEVSGDDETLSGTAITKVRYYLGKWQAFSDTWIDIDTEEVSVTHTKGTYTGTRNQLVAYYMEVLDIVNVGGDNELHINAADWGSKASDNVSYPYYPTDSGSDGLCSVSVQLVYPGGSTNPADTASTLIPKTYLYNYWTKGRGLGTMVFTGNGDYEIYKVTAETGTLSYDKGDGSGIYTPITNIEFSWQNNEETVWGGDDQIPQASASIGNPTGAPTFTAPKDNLAWHKTQYNKNNAILIRVYVKAKEKESNLKVHYIAREDNTENPFYNYDIVVKGDTTFDHGFAKSGDGLINNTVTNSSNQTETVEWDLKRMPQIAAKYKYTEFEFVEARISDDYKEVFLYYTFTNVVKFVVDFGTPLEIKPGDINDNLGNNVSNITKVSVTNNTYGDVTVNETTKAFTYTPGTGFVSSSSGEMLTVEYTGARTDENGQSQDGSVTYQVYIYPASNVLYEENFLENNTAGTAWEDQTVDHNDLQQTQKAGEGNYYTFGYDKSYDSSTDENGVWHIDGLTKERSAPLTATFYGDTFDLIGNCANDSGRVLLLIKGPKSKLVLIDPRYNDGDQGETVLYQVPLAHVEMGVEGTYNVKVYTTSQDEITANTASSQAVAMMALDGYDASEDVIAEILEENDLSIDDVEIVTTSMSQDGVASPVATMSLDDAATEKPVVPHPEGKHVEISGFRVYRSSAVSEDDSTATKTVAANYPTAEQNITYWNILDVVKGQITAYTEAEANLPNVEVKDYEAMGGPQNEIFLTNQQSVQFQIESLKNEIIYVSLRAVSGTTTYNGDQELSSITEMYYPIKADGNGIFTISCNSKNMLAIGNVKLPSNIVADDIKDPSKVSNNLLAAALSAVLHGDEEKEVFIPETFKVTPSTTKLVKNKVVTLKINVSSDVAYITVDGVKYTRSGLQGLFQKTRTIRVVKTAPRDAEKTYEIIAYNSDGVASEPTTITVK